MLHLFYSPAVHICFRKSDKQMHSILPMRRFIWSRLTIMERQPGYSSANALSPFKCRGNTSSTDLISMATRASPITASTSIPVYVRQYDRRSSLSLFYTYFVSLYILKMRPYPHFVLSQFLEVSKA